MMPAFRYLVLCSLSLWAVACKPTSDSAVVVVFDRVDGLEVGSPVQKEDESTIGTVEAIALLKDYRVAVTIVPADTHELPRTGVYEIIAQGAVGKRKIRWSDMPTASQTTLSGDTLIGQSEKRLSIEQAAEALLSMHELGLDTSQGDSLLQSLRKLKAVLDSAQKSPQ